MAREEAKLSEAKASYRSAKAIGNHEEEARWANVIGNLLKDRGEYLQALKWFDIDYHLCTKYLSPKHSLATCQSLGEVYLRLERFEDALVYQKKHLMLAEEANDLVEQQRANTQLGRTYHEMYLKSLDEHQSVQNAKKYFKSAMKLAQAIKENPPSNKSFFIKEYIDAHNNVGLLELDRDNLEEAEKILTRALVICDQEEVNGYDDGRTRLHHNLGKIYTELRMWENAREHIEKDILICKQIGHCEGEAKGYINLGELHNRVQKYQEAILCYQKALDLANSMEDEDALVRQIEDNIKTVKELGKVMDDMKREEQNLKKLTRDMAIARGTTHKRNCQLKQIASLDVLINKSETISAWPKVLEFAKKKKKVATEICDKEKIADSLLSIGESYLKLRKFQKALKWCMKSLKIYKSLGNLEGQALTQINIGHVLDSEGYYEEALNAFTDSYRLAVEGKLSYVQRTALENMHYSNLNRFDDVEETRRLQLEIDKLEQNNEGLETEITAEDRCSESSTEGSGDFSDNMPNACCPEEIRNSQSSKSQSLNQKEELNDDVPLISLIRSTKVSSKMKSAHLENNELGVVGRKRIRLVLSDDEDEMSDEAESPKVRHNKIPLNVATSSEVKTRSNTASPTTKFQDVSAFTSNCATISDPPGNTEESSSSCKSRTLNMATPEGKSFRASSSGEGFNASGSKCDVSVSGNILHKNDAAQFMLLTSDDKHNQCITFEIDEDIIQGSFMASDNLSIESVKVQLACLYYLQLPMERKLEGLVPIIQNVKCGEKVIESLETIKAFRGHMGKIVVEAVLDGWVQKRLIKLYTDHCYKVSETPNMKLLKKLYDLEVSDDEVTVSECELQDLSITPLLNALHAHKTFAMLDLSHNLLGNGTMEKLQQVLTSSGQKYGGLTLDLHCNSFGPTALFQICECPLLFTRLEVLNISGNRLTDACASYLSTILENCKALCSLSIERCSITSRTIQKVADALSAESVLEQLCIGYNKPISGSAITNLLVKLGTLKRFSKLNMNGLKLSKPVVDSLCQLAKRLSLSVLMLGETGVGLDGALLVTESLFHEIEEFVKLDLSYCGVTYNYAVKLSTNSSMVCGILELSLSGNPIMQEGSNALSSMLLNSQCCLKVLVLQKCQLGISGILQIIQALSGNAFLEELNLAENADIGKEYSAPYDVAEKGSVGLSQPNLNMLESSPLVSVLKDVSQLEVADSEDDEVGVEAAASARNESCSSSFQRNSSSTGCQFLEEFSTAIDMAKNLRFLDLSKNGFSTQCAEILYSSWSRSRSVSARRHIKDKTIHFFVEGMMCCVKPCCRKD
ncbi:putative 43kDa postsynaptic protein [Rosa chinensis]|uniref:Protein TONSOKU n=1 Tax=Rosa chinensis TaxID=74649 RepID=A0A2P6RS66_ROSCH|nr:protein TONSOKU [Rosa chinensis]PRQ49276.1 putative 43kDa postsynaptic protein [Rosa chinensis]